MTNPLLVLWHRIVDDDTDDAPPPRHSDTRLEERIRDRRTSAGIFLVLRRMRAPLIVLIVIFAISVLGLTLIPGETDEGLPYRMTIFEAFYFMSYTATTIGFGELPYEFTPTQRLWVTTSIFLAVVGWAYAIGSMLSLIQDRAFRRTLTRRRVARKIESMSEPFLVLVGYGNAGKRVARSLDRTGRRFVVIDDDEDRVAAIDLEDFRADTPALLGNARNTDILVLGGLTHPLCEGVAALTSDDPTNLDITMTAGLLRPDLMVIARTSSRDVGERMSSLGAQEVVNALDRFGDHLRILLRAPSAYQLMVWLTSAPGTRLPRRRDPLPRGRWVVCGNGVAGKELTADLRAEGVEVGLLEETVLDKAGTDAMRGDQPPDVLADAAGFVAATEDDTVNLWLLNQARKHHPDLYLAGVQHRATNAPLFRSAGVDFAMVAAEIIEHEIWARLANPTLMRLLPQVPRLGEEWSASMIDRLVSTCGPRTPPLWSVRLCAEEAPALAAVLGDRRPRLGDLLRSPEDRDDRVDVVPLLLLRGEEAHPGPEDDTVLEPDDELLVAARPTQMRALDATLTLESTAAYVLEDRFVPTSWVWRKILGTHRHDAAEPLA